LGHSEVRGEEETVLNDTTFVVLDPALRRLSTVVELFVDDRLVRGSVPDPPLILTVLGQVESLSRAEERINDLTLHDCEAIVLGPEVGYLRFNCE